jgi:NDP-sugar pyrophosphorylase family protein
MFNIQNYVENFPLRTYLNSYPWNVTNDIELILYEEIKKLSSDFNISDGIAIHKSAIIENGVVLKPPIIVNQNCFIGANAYLRNGVYLSGEVVIGPCCEIKSSLILSKSVVAHFNFIGDTIIGNRVNIEAGAILANHHNDRVEKEIFVLIDGKEFATGVTKFGSFIGDDTKIGANAVLNPGTILPKNTIVKRLQLVDQLK